jgi:hypothetical protein
MLLVLKPYKVIEFDLLKCTWMNKVAEIISNLYNNWTGKDLSSLFDEINPARISNPFKEYLLALNSFYTEYKPHPVQAANFQYYKEFDIDGASDEESDFSDNALRIANYDVKSLKGENVILFSEAVIASEVNCANVRGDDDVSAIRLISHAGTDKKFTTRKTTYNAHIGGRSPNISLVTSYKIHEVIWGIILPKHCNFISVKVVSCKNLHTNQKKLEFVQKALQQAEDAPAIEIENIKNKFSEINSLINMSLDKFNSIQDDCDLANQEQEHAQKNLESSKSLLAKIRADIDKSNKEYEKLGVDVALQAKKLDNLQIVSKENVDKFEKEKTKLEQITSETQKENQALTSIKKELSDANRDKNLSTLDMVGHSNESVKQTRLYSLLAFLVLSGLLWMSVYVYQNGEDFIGILPQLIKVSAWDILISRLPLITATTLIFGGLSGAFFFLVKHIVSLNTEKMTMLKAAILAEQITNSLDCKGMTEQEQLEFKRDTKIKLIMQVFANNEPERDQKNLIIDILNAVSAKK